MRLWAKVGEVEWSRKEIDFVEVDEKFQVDDRIADVSYSQPFKFLQEIFVW